MDPEDNFKAQLADIAEARARRRLHAGYGRMVLSVLLTFGAFVETIFTMPSGWSAGGLLGTAIFGMFTGLALSSANQAKDAFDRAADVNRKWVAEIEVQNREVAREHEDGEPA